VDSSRSRATGFRAWKAYLGESEFEPMTADPRPDRVERLSVHIHGLASGAAGVCMIRPTTSPAGRAAVLLNYVLRPAGLIGHCNVRSSLNVAGEFKTSKKTPPMLRSREDLNLLLKVTGQPGSPTKSKA
jgi:hypothetical protein